MAARQARQRKQRSWAGPGPTAAMTLTCAIYGTGHGNTSSAVAGIGITYMAY